MILRFRLTRAASFSVILTIALIACCKQQPAQFSQASRQILHIGNGSEPQDLDPHTVTGIPEFNIILALTEGLVAFDPHDLHPVPGCAKSWEVSADGRDFTFHIRPEARWSNDDPVTAHDFVYSFKRILTPSLASEYAYMLFCLENGEKYFKGEIADFSRVGAKAIDSLTLSIHLQKPVPYFLSLINHDSWFPVHPATVEKFGGIDKRGSLWTRPGNHVGNGPFVLKQWDVNRAIVVEKSPTYWDRETVRLRQIRFYPIENAQTEERNFRAGQLQVTNTVPLNKIDVYKKDTSGVFHIEPYLATYYYLLNVNRPPFDNPKVRHALALSIDRQSLVDNVLKAGQLPAYNFTPPNTAGYTARAHTSYDVEQARKLLAEAGYPAGAGFPVSEILYNTSEAHQIIAQAIQQMWKKSLNIDVRLVNQEWKVYLETQQRKEYDISRAAWTGDYNDPMTFLDIWVTGGGNNRAGYSNLRYDSLIDAASMAGDNAQRFEIFQTAEQLLMDEMPIIPIYYYTRTVLIHKSVKGWYPNILDLHPYKYVYLQGE